MNGHDIYLPVRLIQATNGVVMLRPGNARYYFTEADVNTGNNTVTLNVVPDLAVAPVFDFLDIAAASISFLANIGTVNFFEFAGGALESDLLFTDFLAELLVVKPRERAFAGNRLDKGAIGGQHEDHVRHVGAVGDDDLFAPLGGAGNRVDVVKLVRLVADLEADRAVVFDPFEPGGIQQHGELVVAEREARGNARLPDGEFFVG